MDMSNNVIPEHIKTIHLIAVCGTGMGALACMLKDKGFQVTGSDHNVYPPISDFLIQKGIPILSGFTADNLAYAPDLVIVGNAVRKDNPEATQMIEMGLNFCSMPQALNHFIASDKKALLATGTHGKTTTASLLAWVLYTAKYDPSFMIGGILKNFDSNYYLGNGNCIVIEGDEYDTAFFDKGAKFLHYDPFIAILTSVEFDHADIFRDIGHVKDTFDKFISGISQQHVLLAFDQDQNISELTKQKACGIQFYGRKRSSDWRLGPIRIEPPWTFFDVFKRECIFASFRTKLIGEHNLLNALAVIAAAHLMDVSIADIQKALETFEGVKRRQEIRGVVNGVTVLDDFAHHPTAVLETIRAVKPFYPSGRLIAVFEPRTNSSMRAVFQDVYPSCFDAADIICIREPSMLEKIPEKERFSSPKLVSDIKSRGKDAYFFADTTPIITFLADTVRQGDVILIMSNGGFDNIHVRLLDALRG